MEFVRRSLEKDITAKKQNEAAHQKTIYLKKFQESDRFYQQKPLQLKCGDRIKNAQIKKLYNECSHIDKKVYDSTRWSRFKERRTQIVNHYIQTKKKLEQVKRLKAIVQMSATVRRAYHNLQERKRWNQVYIMRVFICLKLNKLWRRKHVRKGANFEDIFA